MDKNSLVRQIARATTINMFAGFGCIVGMGGAMMVVGWLMDRQEKKTPAEK